MVTIDFNPINSDSRLIQGTQPNIQTPHRRCRVALRTAIWLVMIGVLAVAPASPVLAQAGGDISAAFSGIVTTITDIIQSLTVVVGILGVTHGALPRWPAPSSRNSRS